jgi:hypothetical protein
MVTIPTIYNQNEQNIATNLLPLQRRKPVFIAWLASVMNPIQWFQTYFNYYYGGFNGNTWVTGNTYSYGDVVVYYDGCVYEMINTSGLTSTTPPPQDTSNWYKMLDTFVGVKERVKYTGQLVVLEYLINRYFSVISPSIAPTLPFTGASHTTQIYISNNGSSVFQFYMGNGSNTFQAYMGDGSSNFQYYLGDSYNTNSFTVYVPVAVDAAITSYQASGVTAEDVVRSVLDKYVQAGKVYNYLTY